MPFDVRNLGHIGGGVFRYRTRDDAAAVNAPGYWTAAWPMLRRGDAVFRTTVDVNGQVMSQGRHVITAASLTAVSSVDGFGSGGVITPPEGTQFTSISWRGEGLLAAIAGGLANNELAYNTGLLDFRSDQDLLVTTADGAVSTLTSGQGFTGTLTQATAANQPVHSSATDRITFASAAENDTANGDWLTMPSIATRYSSGAANQPGMFWLLFRMPTVPPAYRTTLIRVGANSGTYNRETGRAYMLIVTTGGILQCYREGDTGGTFLLASTGVSLTAGLWTAVGFTLQRAGEQISRIHIKQPGGAFPTMASFATAATTSVAAMSPQVAMVNRSLWNNNAGNAGIGNGWEMHSIGFDAAPPTADADILNNLDKLLARI